MSAVGTTARYLQIRVTRVKPLTIRDGESLDYGFAALQNDDIDIVVLQDGEPVTKTLSISNR